MIAYEKLREWEEGLAKYTELELWRRASESSDYQSLPGLASESEFHHYDSFTKRWQSELSNIRSEPGDNLLYYTGMAQAFLLDRLMPGWQERILGDDVTLEDLLHQAVTR